tara:strand:+ start:11526 stop:13946 length:2421 start_codon:yes stop_codon:yes gene_type:complete
MKGLFLVILSLIIVSCSSGGSSQQATPVIQQNIIVEQDDRIEFAPFTKEMTSPWGEVSIEYSMTGHQPASKWPSNDKYKIEDYGFLSVTTIGTHPGDSYNPDEISEAGPYFNNAQWFEANLNQDEHSDLIYIGNNCCNRDYVLEDLMLTFLNDGNGHFLLSKETFADGQFPCVNGGKSWLSDDIDTLHPCGNQGDYTNGKIVADFNGDGISDYYDTSILYLSNKQGKLENMSFSNLPSLFFEKGHGQIFVHDAAYGDLDGDGDLDIFVPISDYTSIGYKFGGNEDLCSGCTENIPYTALINDGNGNFEANHLIPQLDYWVNVDYDNWGNNIDQLWPTTATIGDFDNDGYGDIALGWFNPIIADRYGFSVESSGVVYFNDGNNDWSKRKYLELPKNFFGSNGNANDMEVLDFNNDGYADILLASTIHEPYYTSRVIQFFQNEGGISFRDVTTDISPDHEKYANGNPYSQWWVGQGKLHILDYDHDGDLDIVDTNTRTTVYINNQNSFDIYDNFVDTDEDVLLWPIEIDGKYHYDFIGSDISNCFEDRCVTNFYQLLDPPASNLIDDFFQKPDGFIDSIFEASYLGDYLRVKPEDGSIHFHTDTLTSSLGYISRNDKLAFFTGKIRGFHYGNYVGTSYDQEYFSFGHIATSLSTNSISNTEWFGSGNANLNLLANETFIELNLINSDSFSLNAGYLVNKTRIDEFSEYGSFVNLRYTENKFKYFAKFVDFKYGFDFRSYSFNFSGGKRVNTNKQKFSMKTRDGLVFTNDGNISNEYFSMSIIKNIFYLKAVKTTYSETKILGGFQINF